VSDEDQIAYLKSINRELAVIRQQLTEVIAYIRDAEKEVPERVRRFIMYMHDVHDIKVLYESQGQTVPNHVIREMERCDDRYRQIVKELHEDGGAFEKVRAEMAKDTENRWDHTRRLFAPKKEPTNEARPSTQQPNGLHEG
jgi:uncharacterized protein YydD (DUF2326 family)